MLTKCAECHAELPCSVDTCAPGHLVGNIIVRVEPCPVCTKQHEMAQQRIDRAYIHLEHVAKPVLERVVNQRLELMKLGLQDIVNSVQEALNDLSVMAKDDGQIETPHVHPDVDAIINDET